MAEDEAVRAAERDDLQKALRHAFAEGAIWGLRSVRNAQTGTDMTEAARVYAERNSKTDAGRAALAGEGGGEP